MFLRILASWCCPMVAPSTSDPWQKLQATYNPIVKPLRVLSLFDGISAGQISLRNLGIPVESYTASEIEPNAIKVTQSNFPNTIQVGDVTKLHISEGQFDLCLCGSPCQDLSRAGVGKGLDGERSKLFWEYVRLCKEGNIPWRFLENNKMKKEYSDIITEAVGVSPILLNASLLSCQNRERNFWSNIPNGGIPKDKGITLTDVIGPYDGQIWVYPRGWNQKGIHTYKNDKSPCLTVSSWEHNFFYMKNGEKVAFTPEQAEAIQGFPQGYTSIVSKSQRFKRLGNSWSVPVVQYLLEGLKQVVG
jgi:site-specific DNA-cytosine methylase